MAERYGVLQRLQPSGSVHSRWELRTPSPGWQAWAGASLDDTIARTEALARANNKTYAVLRSPAVDVDVWFAAEAYGRRIRKDGTPMPGARLQPLDGASKVGFTAGATFDATPIAAIVTDSHTLRLTDSLPEPISSATEQEVWAGATTPQVRVDTFEGTQQLHLRVPLAHEAKRLTATDPADALREAQHDARTGAQLVMRGADGSMWTSVAYEQSRSGATWSQLQPTSITSDMNVTPIATGWREWIVGLATADATWDLTSVPSS
jgi:hypothetical protein